MVGGPAANSYFLPVSVDACTETERRLYRLSLPESTATGIQRLLSGSRSLTGVDSSWMLSKSPVSQPCRAHVCKSLLLQNQGLGRPGLAVL